MSHFIINTINTQKQFAKYHNYSFIQNGAFPISHSAKTFIWILHTWILQFGFPDLLAFMTTAKIGEARSNPSEKYP